MSIIDMIPRSELLRELDARQFEDHRSPRRQLPLPSSATRKLLADLSEPTLFARARGGYGKDNRQEIFDVPDPHCVRSAACVAAVIRREYVRDVDWCRREIKKLDKETGELVTLSSSFGGLCQREMYRFQPAPVHMTGFLVRPDIIATAGHAIPHRNLQNYCFVFGYWMKNGHARSVVPRRDVVYPERFLASGGSSDDESDWALIKLQKKQWWRPIPRLRTEGKIQRGSPVYVVGHSFGIPMKLADGAEVQGDSQHSFSFKATIDSFTHGSGSPVFAADTHIVEGIHVRGMKDTVVCPDPSTPQCPRGYFTYKSCETSCIHIVFLHDYDENSGEECTRITEILDHLP